MMIEPGRYTSGRVALANLSASIDGLERRRRAGASFEDLASLSKLLFLRGDVLGRIEDYDHAERVAFEAIDLSPATARALVLRAKVAARFHHFAEARALLDRARASGHPSYEIDTEIAALLQATGGYNEARALRERLVAAYPSIQNLGALATLLAETNEWAAAQAAYGAALDADDAASPFSCAQLLFEWGVSAMRSSDLDGADAVFAELDAILPEHVPARGHRAEVALAQGRLHVAEALIAPLLAISDDPEYRATYAEILATRGDGKALLEAARTAAAYEQLLARRPEAYADHAAAFFLGVGGRPQRALELALANFKLRDTPRSRRLLEKARRRVQEEVAA
jgi:hypothetical protein